MSDNIRRILAVWVVASAILALTEMRSNHEPFCEFASESQGYSCTAIPGGAIAFERVRHVDGRLHGHGQRLN